MASVSGVSYAEQGKWDFRGADTKEYTHCFAWVVLVWIMSQPLFSEFGFRTREAQANKKPPEFACYSGGMDS